MTVGVRALALSLAIASALSLHGCGRSEAQGGPPMAPPVSAAPAVARDVPLYDEFSGRLEAVETVELRSQVAGTLQRVHFRDGQEVRRGELMFSIDPRPFQAELARLEAQLVAARNAAALSDTELARTRKLLEQKAVSQQEAAEKAEAAARNAASAVRAAEAGVAAAKLNVEYTQIRAPISGPASRANVTAGNLVAAGDPVLTSIVAQNKVHALVRRQRARPRLRVRSQFKGNAAPKVQMALADERGFPHTGSVDFVDNRLNPATGAIRVRAVFDNPDRRFVPGLYARVRLAGGTATQAVLTPERAIGTDQTKRYVFVVGPDKTAQFREVQLGALAGNGMRVITGGLKAGELVVVNGLQRVRPGAPLNAQVLAVDAQGVPVEPPPPGAPAAPAASSPTKS
ncbi:efflux RND transporter periplasmic adaptor subunit [Piscinibacter aquaticus]|uniref:Efflux RND transporter periplasmic adaptor subunit n=1 Tax=Piscinibacter aquaticus TaxID=392597 RepID=A0A5C6U5K5_9BURK|nr:efflux RND transporter periplasmic adaptor subunit [Piscinibacter aquaticus]